MYVSRASVAAVLAAIAAAATPEAAAAIVACNHTGDPAIQPIPCFVESNLFGLYLLGLLELRL